MIPYLKEENIWHFGVFNLEFFKMSFTIDGYGNALFIDSLCDIQIAQYIWTDIHILMIASSMLYRYNCRYKCSGYAVAMES